MRADELLVSASWLSQHLDEPSIRVLDASVWLVLAEDGSVTAKSGREHWEAGHIPGSAFVDLLALSDPGEGNRSRLPSPEAFASVMGEVGVGPQTRVITYDSGTVIWATRLWWMLRFFGHEAVSVLDGGWRAWTAADLPVSQERAQRRRARFEAQVRPQQLATLEQVEANVKDGSRSLINALSPEMFRGEAVIQYRRAGRIPGSLNLPYYELLDASSGRFLPASEIEEKFANTGALDDESQLVTYCGGGVAATADAFALALTGREAAVYDGSLAEWTADVNRPLEVG